MNPTQTPHPPNSSMATHVNEPFLVERNETELVRPSEPTPCDVLSLSTVDNDPNLELICQTIHVYCADDTIYDDNDSNGHVKRHSMPDPALVIREALSKALVYYYPLAGKLKRHDDGKLRVNCVGEGVPFVAATANCTIASLNYLDGVDVDTAKCLIFKVATDNEGYNPLMIQVTKFRCGGFTVGMGLSHSMCDGFGSAQFFQAVAELAVGKGEPSIKPVWERERLVAKDTYGPMFPLMNPLALATSPYLPTSDVLHESFNVDSESLRKLKMRLSKESNGDGGLSESLTSLEVLSSYVWRARFRALEMNLDGETTLGMAVGLRNVMDPPLPQGYYGNAFVSSYAVICGKDLCEMPLSRVARLIKESKKKATKAEYIWSGLRFLEKMNSSNRKLEARGGSMILTDWRHMGIFEVDFGWKRSLNVFPVPWNMFGYVDLCIFLPPCHLNTSMKGGVRVLVCLPRAAMPKFKEEMDALKFGPKISKVECLSE